MPFSSPSQHEGTTEVSRQRREGEALGLTDTDPREATRRFLVHKGLDFDLALAAGVKYEPGGRLWFNYEAPNGDLARRVFDTRTAITAPGTNYRFWERGSHAKGTLWFPTNEHCTDPRTVLLCEGETDALAAVQARCPWTVAAVPGASMSDTTLREFAKQRGWDRVIVAFDNDEAGHKGARKVAQDAGNVPVCRLTPPDGDLKEWLQGNQPRVHEADWSRIELVLEDFAPLEAPRPLPERIKLPEFKRPLLGDERPDLLTVWRSIARPLPHRPARRDGQGRQLREAFCPFHDDGREPGAWVGETRWGCWVCGIESADVYELLAWHHNLVPLGTKVTGSAFREAKDLGRAYTGGL